MWAGVRAKIKSLLSELKEVTFLLLTFHFTDQSLEKYGMKRKSFKDTKQLKIANQQKIFISAFHL